MKYLIVDGLGLVYRSYYAFSDLYTSSGINSGSVYGFLNSLQKIKRVHSDSYIIIAWDSKTSRRKMIFDGYKAHRHTVDFHEQIDDIKAICKCLNLSQSEHIHEEADDVIASLVHLYSKDIIYIYSADKDMFQLISSHVTVIRPKRGKIAEKYYTRDSVKKEFNVLPENFACYQSLRGDSVDNISGLTRVPSSLIAYLSEKYKSPAAIYMYLEEEKLTPYQKKTFLENEKRIMTNYELVELRKDLELEISKGESNIEGLKPFFEKYEIRSIQPQQLVDVFKSIFISKKTSSKEYKNYTIFD